MIIVSNFKDFYDWVAGTYYDEKLKYVRQTERKEIQQQYPNIISNFERSGENTAEYSLLFIFGKAYPVVITEVQKTKPSKDIPYPKKIRRVFFVSDTDEFNRAATHLKKYNLLSGLGYWRKPKIERFRRWVDERKSTPSKYNDCPFYVLGYNYLIENPCLLDYGAAKFFDPVTFYQELAMWVGQNLYNEDTVEISDKNKVEQKGFDPVYGFRKLPQK